MSDLPNDLNAEKVVLGGLMLGARADDLVSADFYRPAHQLVYEAVVALRSACKPTDPVAVADELRRRDQLTKMGGATYLHDCLEAVPAAAHTGHYAAIVQEHAERRRLLEYTERLRQAAADPASDIGTVRGLLSTAPPARSDTSNGSDSVQEARDAHLLAGVRDGAWLDAQDIPPLRYAIEGLIPEGMTLLVGPPKAGKSWLILDLLLAVASGGRALGHLAVSDPRRVLYLALEDGDRRMQDRCRALLDQDPIPPLFGYQTRIEAGAVLETLDAWMRRHPDTGLIVIDTLGKVMPPSFMGESSYQRDYRIGSALKERADSNPGLAVVILHHDRKAGAEDFVDSVSATHGLAGSADTIAVLCRQRQATEGALKITGRDVAENEYALTMRGGIAWQLAAPDLSAAAAIARQRSDLVALGDRSGEVLAFVNRRPDGALAKDVVEKFGKDAYQYLKRLTDTGRIDKVARGRYVPLIPLSEPSELSEEPDAGSGDEAER